MTCRSAFLILGLSLGCNGTNDKPGPAASERDLARALSPADLGDDSAPAAREPNLEKRRAARPQAPTEGFAPLVATPPTAPPHDVPPSPSTRSVNVLKEVTGCPPMPSSGLTDDQLAAQELLRPLRELSCKPELMGKPLSEIISATSAPPELDLQVGNVYGAVEASSTSVASIAIAAGIGDPELRLEQGRAPSWVVVADGEDLAPILWGAARLVISVRGARHEDKKGGTRKPIEADTVPTSLRILFDHDVLRYDPDPAAPTAIASALLALAAKPELLALKPETINEEIVVLGERFAVSRYSVGASTGKRVGIVIRPRRTELRATDLVQALGFPADTVQRTNIGTRHTNGNRLEAGGRTKIPWRGLVLEVTVARTADGIGLLPWIVKQVKVLPPETKPAN